MPQSQPAGRTRANADAGRDNCLQLARRGWRFFYAWSYAVTQNWRVRMQYVNYGTLKWKGDNQASVKSQTLSVGVAYTFR